jgi:hypothetical protein
MTLENLWEKVKFPLGGFTTSQRNSKRQSHDSKDLTKKRKLYFTPFSWKES